MHITKDQPNKLKHIYAFTMVEMSVVIVIIAMIIGAITVGSSLIKDGKVKTIIKEYRFYNTAVNSFVDKFNAYPGDFNRATDYWYNATTCPGTSGVTGQCNGDSTGYITANGGTDSDEGIRAWQHLNLAGILNIPYTGIHTVTNQNDIGVNVPASDFRAEVGWVFSAAIPYKTPGYYDTNALYLGAFAANLYNDLPILNPLEMMAIDNKIDDGFPTTGLVMGSYIYMAAGSLWYTTTDITQACAIGSTNRYNTSYVNILCKPHFLIE